MPVTDNVMLSGFPFCGICWTDAVAKKTSVTRVVRSLILINEDLRSLLRKTCSRANFSQKS
jgi:hypothetical protein